MIVRRIVFDFDGVLADSEPLHLRAYQEVLSPLGVDADARGLLRPTFSDTTMWACFRRSRTRGAGDGRARSWRRSSREKGRACDAMIDADGRALPRRGRLHRTDGGRVSARHRVGRPQARDRGDPRRERLERHFRFIVASGTRRRASPRPIRTARAARAPRSPARARAWPSRTRGGASSPRNRPGCACIGVTHTYPAKELPWRTRSWRRSTSSHRN